MHGFHAGFSRHLEKLERRLAGLQEPETTDQSDRRMTLCRAALSGRQPEDLQESEAELFEKIAASIPIFEELIHEGIIDDDGQPGGADSHRDPHEDDDGRPVWRP